jgi:hypothetical protein
MRKPLLWKRRCSGSDDYSHRSGLGEFDLRCVYRQRITPDMSACGQVSRTKWAGSLAWSRAPRLGQRKRATVCTRSPALLKPSWKATRINHQSIPSESSPHPQSDLAIITGSYPPRNPGKTIRCPIRQPSASDPRLFSCFLVRILVGLIGDDGLIGDGLIGDRRRVCRR